MTVQTAARRLAIIGPSADSLLRLRAPLIRVLTGKRHKVLCVIPAVSKEEQAAIAACIAGDELDHLYVIPSWWSGLFRRNRADTTMAS